MSMNRLINRLEEAVKKTEKGSDFPDELLKKFYSLFLSMNNENIYQDGEASQSEVNRTIRNLKKSWSELERKLGKKVDEYEIEQRYLDKFEPNHDEYVKNLIANRLRDQMRGKTKWLDSGEYGYWTPEDIEKAVERQEKQRQSEKKRYK